MNQTLSDLLQLKPLQLPPAPSWWPIAWGWVSLLGGLFAIMILLVVWLRWRAKKLAPKKAALRLLELTKHSMTPSDAMELVRQATLSYFPREQVAQLTGSEWYAFLDDYAEQARFSQNQDLWQQALYQKTAINEADRLIDDCHAWIQSALPPKKRRH